MDYQKFVDLNKSLLIAPAGYGKTFTISECLKYTKGRQLILTHTNVGIGAIKEKLIKKQISPDKYQIETISTFAQKYVLSYYKGEDIPLQENAKEYYPFILYKAIQLFKISFFQTILKVNYSGLFVDEYQDCTALQHNLINELSNILPTHLLGDPLQGIFGFDGLLVDIINPLQMGEFIENKFELNEPERWKRTNISLGENLKAIRKKLENLESFDLNQYSSIEKHIINEGDLYKPKSKYNKLVWELLREKNLLIIHPESSSIEPRKTFCANFKQSAYLLESIDDKDFYRIAVLLDEVSRDTIDSKLSDIASNLFNSNFGTWINRKGLVKKKQLTDQNITTPLSELITLYKVNESKLVLRDILQAIKSLPKVRCYRSDLFFSLCSALEISDSTKGTVKESIQTQRNLTRRIGRRVFGRNIGTTLLTKGLEFDNVIILNAHKIKCHKNLYVALTRASKRLIVFTNNLTLKPYKDISPQTTKKVRSKVNKSQLSLDI